LKFNIAYEESELIALLKQKSSRAFVSLYNIYAATIYTVILQIVKDKEVANNVIQDVFLIIMDRIDSYDHSKESLFIWILKITRNAAIKVVKSKNTQLSLKQQLIVDEKSGKLDNLEIDNYGLKNVIMKLKEEQKVFIDLCYYKDFRHDEIAEILDIPLDTVNKRLKIALSELRTLLVKTK
jgi:RNA polymerase sigma factor (sigma-70 family)